MKKYALTLWNEEYQRSFDTMKDYLTNPLVLVPPREESPMLLYMSVSENIFGCVLGLHD